MTDEQSNNCVFRTKDLNQAAFMWCQPGARLVRLEGEKAKGKTVYFVFELPFPEEELGVLIIKYANKETTVEPQTYCSQQTNLRDLLHGNLTREKRSVVL